MDNVNRMLQCRSGSMYVVLTNLSSLVEDLNKLRNESWDQIFNKAVLVAKNIGYPQHLEEELKSK